MRTKIKSVSFLIFVLLILTIFSSISVFSDSSNQTKISIPAEIFNKKLTDEERAVLEKGEVLIKNIDSMKNISINPIPETEKTISIMTDLKPKYIAEIIQIRPYEGNENLLEKINNTLMNVSDYVGIPYFSERRQELFELYSAAEIVNLTKNENKTEIDAVLNMSLFGDFNTKIEIEAGDDAYFYTMKNIDKLVYRKKFTAVKAERMKSCICVFRDGENWILYSIGGVNTLRIFFLEDRIETSFLNRIKSFCNFIFTKI